jgi:hypothetical protein
MLTDQLRCLVLDLELVLIAENLALEPNVHYLGFGELALQLRLLQELVVESAERQRVADCGVGRAGSPSRPVAGW